MFRATRITVAAVVALAIVVLPVLLNQCAESCEAHRYTVASTSALSTISRIGLLLPTRYLGDQKKDDP